MAREKRVKGVVKAIEVLLAVLTVLAFAKSIWISLDMDESYAVALGYRMARGDMLVRDMWEPHQFSGFLAALFTGPYLLFRGGQYRLSCDLSQNRGRSDSYGVRAGAVPAAPEKVPWLFRLWHDDSAPELSAQMGADAGI